jgi:hypothetical protein
VLLLAGRRLLYFENTIIIIKEDDSWRKGFQFGIFDITVAEDNDLVSDDTFPGCRAVQAYLAFLTGDDIRLKPFAVIDITDHYLFIWQDPGLLEDSFINGDASLIGKVGFGNGCYMDFGP